jgi:hypothetical protein
MYLAGNAAWRAKIRPFEPAMMHKEHLSRLGKRGNTAYSESRSEVHDHWQETADTIKTKHPKWSKTRIAEEIGKIENVSSETVRKNIVI